MSAYLFNFYYIKFQMCAKIEYVISYAHWHICRYKNMLNPISYIDLVLKFIDKS